MQNTKKLVNTWFKLWKNGRFGELPISESFRHHSPFGTIDGKHAYLNLVEANQEKFLGYTFDIHDAIYTHNSACVRYTGKQGDFSLDVSEWYYLQDGQISEIYAYYHIGEIMVNRKLTK